MTSLSDERVFELASAVRFAFEQASRARLPATLQDFPSGACGDAECMVAKLLEMHGDGEFDYMLGSRAEHSHAWIQRGDLIVDITADQFDDYSLPVTVSRNSLWHADFEGERLHVADFSIWSRDAPHLRGVFSHLCSLLPANAKPPAGMPVPMKSEQTQR
jgi:hypothetical protein